MKKLEKKAANKPNDKTRKYTFARKKGKTCKTLVSHKKKDLVPLQNKDELKKCQSSNMIYQCQNNINDDISKNNPKQMSVFNRFVVKVESPSQTQSNKENINYFKNKSSYSLTDDFTCMFSKPFSNLDLRCVFKDISNIEKLLATKGNVKSDEKYIDFQRSKKDKNSNSAERILENIPGIALKDRFFWIQPVRTIHDVNVLEIIPQKSNKPENTKTNNSVFAKNSNISPQTGNIQSIQCTSSTFKSGKEKIDASTNTLCNNNDLNIVDFLCKNEPVPNFFNLNVNISSDNNNCKSNDYFSANVLHKTEQSKVNSNDLNGNKELYSKKHFQLKNEETNSIASIVKHGEVLKNGTEGIKTIMNLTNFYNDAKNQIDDQECESPLCEINENSQYESVTVLKTEPIIDHSTINNLNLTATNTKHINNLDNAIFIFENNLDPLEKGIVKNSLIKDEPIPIQCKFEPNMTNSVSVSTMSNSINLNNVSNCIGVKSNKEKSKLHKATSPPFKNLAELKNSTRKKTIESANNSVLINDINSNIINNIGGFVSCNQNKTGNNEINLKYLSLGEDAGAGKIFFKTPNTSIKPEFKLGNLMKSKTPITFADRNNSNVKYLVKDKNIFKLVYVKTPTVDVGTNSLHIINQNKKTEVKERKTNDIGCQSDSKKTIFSLEPSTPHLPKLVNFESVQNKNMKLTEVSKLIKINSVETNDDKKAEGAPSKAMNIFYHPTKQPLIFESKNVIVSLPSAKGKKESSVVDTQGKIVSFALGKEVDKKTNKITSLEKKNIGANNSESSSDQTPAISSTAMEQVREFESILEKVTKTSQLKEKISPVEGMDDSSNSSSTSHGAPPQNINILLQPTKIATYTNLIYSSEKNIVIPEKSPSIKNAIISPKGENKVIKQGNPSFQSSPAVSPIHSVSPTSTAATKPLQKAQEDEKTTEKIYKILHSYSEKIKNAPELKNKPAPRRRSNPPISNSSKCKKNIKFTGKPGFETNGSSELNSEVDSSEKDVVRKVFPKTTNQNKETTMSTPVQIRHLTMPLSAAQNNQVLFVTNDKHLILKKIKNVPKMWAKNSVAVQPLLNVESGVQNTQVVHYNIKNNTMNGVSFINYFSPVGKPTNIINTHVATTFPHPTSNAVSHHTQVYKLAQETQTDVSMQFSTLGKNQPVKVKMEHKGTQRSTLMKGYNDRNSSRYRERNFNHLAFEQIHFVINLDQYYLRNIDVLFFTSLIFLKYPSSQLFMFETINALKRIMQTNPSLVSNNSGKKCSLEQMQELGSEFWKQFRIIYDIILKKRGPHITDTVIMITEKVDSKTNDKKVKTTNTDSDDKIKVNKCNKNPKCYGKKPVESSSTNKNTKFPYPLEPRVIVTNRSDDDDDYDNGKEYGRVSKYSRKRSYNKVGPIDFDLIEIDNPKNSTPKRRKKTKVVTTIVKPYDILKSKDLNYGKTTNSSDKNKRKNVTTKHPPKKKIVRSTNIPIEKPNFKTRNSVLKRTESKPATKYVGLDFEKNVSRTQRNTLNNNNNSSKDVSPKETGYDKSSPKVTKPTTRYFMANKRTLSTRGIVNMQSNKKQKIN